MVKHSTKIYPRAVKLQGICGLQDVNDADLLSLDLQNPTFKPKLKKKKVIKVINLEPKTTRDQNVDELF